MEIAFLTGDLEGAYQTFLAEDERNQIYPTLEYRDFLVAAVPGEARCLLAIENGKILGVLPYFRQECAGLGVVLNSLPWFGSHGGCTLASTASQDVRQALLRAYRQAVEHPEVLSSTVILTPNETKHLQQYAEVLHPSVLDRRVGQVTELPESGLDLEKRLEARLSQKTRNLVRKSLKQGFAFTAADEEWAWRFLFETHMANMAAIGGCAKRWGDFVALRKSIPTACRRLFLAMDGGRPVAALLLLYFNQTVEYFTPVIGHDDRPRQPLSFLIWHGMLEAIQRRCRWWNWGGTWESQRSLHHFKAGWGAVDRPYVYLINLKDRALAELHAHRTQLQDLLYGYYLYPYQLVKS